MADLFEITLEDMAAEAEREVRLRSRVYPAWVADRRLTQHRADRQLAVMKAIATRLRAATAAPHFLLDTYPGAQDPGYPGSET